jgi:hypothetical protein
MIFMTLEHPTTGDRETVDQPYHDAWMARESAETDYPYFGWNAIAESDGIPPDESEIVDGAHVVPLEVRKARKLEQVKVKQAEAFLAGWTHDFGPEVGTHTLDLRDADDKGNWTLLLIETQGMIATGEGENLVRIRTSTNEEIFIPATQAFMTMRQFLAWGKAVFARKWDLDKQITEATDEMLDTLDLETWP